jgi:hypothetical protein
MGFIAEKGMGTVDSVNYLDSYFYASSLLRNNTKEGVLVFWMTDKNGTVRLGDIYPNAVHVAYLAPANTLITPTPLPQQGPDLLSGKLEQRCR